MFLHALRNSERFGLFKLMRMLTGRFREVGSSTNCVNCVWFSSKSNSFLGKCLETRLRRAGKTRFLVSVVATHIWLLSGPCPPQELGYRGARTDRACSTCSFVDHYQYRQSKDSHQVAFSHIS